MSEGTQNQRRMSDILFYIDSELNVVEGNRSFLRFFDTPVETINLCDYLPPFDVKNLKSYLKQFKTGKEDFYLIVTITVSSYSFLSIMQISRDESHKDCYRIDLSDFTYSREHTEESARRLRIYETLIHHYNSYFFIFEEGRFTLSCTKKLSPLFSGSVFDAKSKAVDQFRLDIEDCQTSFQYDLLFQDLVAGITHKSYKLHTLDNNFLTISTCEVPMREKTLLMGIISDGNEVILTENTYTANNDGMTNLLNKKAITDFARNKIDVLKTPSSLFIIDIDHFKDFNDNFGHSFGDKIIVTLANCLKDAVNGIGTAGRIGGDEFLCLIDTVDEDMIRSVARNIKLGLQWSIPAENVDALVTCSIGIARYPDNAASFDQLFATADKCLYIAKSRGRNCYIIYNAEKHGAIQIAPDGKARQNEKGTALMESAEQEIAIMRTFLSRKKNATEQFLQMLLEYMHVHCITVYKWNGKEFSELYMMGRRDVDNRIARLNSPDYFKNFNSSSFLHMDSTTVLDTVDRESFRMYATADINSTIEVLCKTEKGENSLLVCFDIYRPARTFEQNKIVFALMVSKILGETL